MYNNILLKSSLLPFGPLKGIGMYFYKKYYIFSKKIIHMYSKDYIREQELIFS